MSRRKAVSPSIRSCYSTVVRGVDYPHLMFAARYAAGKLTMGFWQHWVPGADQASTDLVNEWAAREKVEVSIDYITSNGKKNLRSRLPPKPRPKSGHDIHCDADLVAACAVRTARTDERRCRAAHQVKMAKSTAP